MPPHLSRIRFIALSAALFPSICAAATPSFLCNKASTWIEKTICSSDRLAALDLELAAVYARCLRAKEPVSVKTTQTDQHKWWGERARCQKHADPVACVERSYGARIAALKSRPDYPGDQPVKAPKIIKDVPIKEIGQGWSRDMSEYFRAIKLCSTKWRTPVHAVLKAWREGRGETISMWLRSDDDQNLLCNASKNGKELKLLRPQAVDEDVPVAGPILYLGKTEPTNPCKDAVRVLDPDGKDFGWLSAAPCSAS